MDEFAKKFDNMTAGELEELYYSMCDFDQKPVTIEEFLDSPQYLGPYFQDGLYPYWREVLKKIYPSPYTSPYWCVAFRGAIGQGKTTIACAGIAYDLYLLMCMTKPQKEIGLMEHTKIVFAIFNVTLALATDVVWDTLSQMFVTSPYFSKYTNNLGKKRRNEDTLFPKRIDFFMGSRLGHTLGKAVHSAILSEANFEVLEGQVYDAFTSILSRMSSRFMKRGGGIRGKIWVDSSESDKFSAVNQIVEKHKADPGVLVVQSALWQVAPHKYGKERFWVYVGSDARGPEIITDDNRALLRTEPDLCIQVPVEHRQNFVADIHDALRSLAGVSTGSTYKLFRIKEKLTSQIKVKVLFPDVIRLDFDDKTDQVANYAKRPDYFASPAHPKSARYIHIDIGLTGDKLGIAASYISNIVERKSRDIHTFAEVSEVVPEIVTEWAFAVEPTPGKQVPLYKIRAFIQWLSSQGTIVGGVSADGFQSADMLQSLTAMGYTNVELISIDKTPLPYLQFRNAVYEERLVIPQNELLQRECENLLMSPDGKKVDHPKENVDGTPGSKDIADAVAGSSQMAVANMGNFNILQLIDDKPRSEETIAKTFWPGKDFSTPVDDDDGEYD